MNAQALKTCWKNLSWKKTNSTLGTFYQTPYRTRLHWNWSRTTHVRPVKLWSHPTAVSNYHYLKNDLQLLDNIAVPCAVGTFYNKDTKTCLPCPQGSYQSEAGQSQCIECPMIAGRPGVTVGTGARSAADCKGKFSSILLKLNYETNDWLNKANFQLNWIIVSEMSH